MKFIITVFLSLVFACQLFGQDKSPFINSVVVEYQKATFDEALGLGLGINHWIKATGKRNFQLGLMAYGFGAPGSSPNTSGNLNEFNGGLHLRLHAGLERNYFAKQKLYTFASLYAGLRINMVDGSLNQPNQGFAREVSLTTYNGDFGTRIGIGYRFTEKLGAHVSLTNSWLHATNPLGFWPGMLFWGPDALSLVGIGVNYRL
ncbi:MAG: hypothetical protein MRZ79_03665 [Bacteroidia bacterium]|nr:hypothetical protein [Bacteroidia bacterium]